MGKGKDSKLKQKYDVETGFLENGQPYARIGKKPDIIINIEALTYKHEPPSGFVLKQFIKDSQIFLEDYTVYLIGRKPNLPKNYFMDKMANDYAQVIRNEFGKPVIIMGASTGGQIAQYLAANHSDIIQKLVIISAAYKISEQGEEIERKSAEYFEKEKYGKYLSTTMDLGEIKYPNDYLVEVMADRVMNFRDRLNEINAPTLILSGERVICYAVEDVQETAKGIPNSELILYEDYGHNLIMANRKQVQKEILAFLKK
ncbi:MAG: alpha/beta hydrolase [Promethearchaeota archaeon]|nr:MAG: alpha/beta hydrolase [Candidatus Lokiarchaeota archaeon]